MNKKHENPYSNVKETGKLSKSRMKSEKRSYSDESESIHWSVAKKFHKDKTSRKLNNEKTFMKPNKRKHDVETSSDEGNDFDSDSSEEGEELIDSFSRKVKKIHQTDSNIGYSYESSSDFSDSESEERTGKTSYCVKKHNKINRKKPLSNEKISTNVIKDKKMKKSSSETRDGNHLKIGEDSDMSSGEKVGDADSSDATDTCNDEYAEIKKELAEMSFEQLQKLQDKMGLKSFNQLFHGKAEASISDKPKTKIKKFKRENKNRPMEISSKRPVSVVRDRFPVKKKMHRDPRFDDLSGEYNEAIFKNAYSFVDDIKAKEKKEIMKKFERAQNPETKDQFKQLLNRMDQQELVSKKKEKEQTRSRELKKKERESVKEGKNPFFLKKSEKRKMELAEKFKELKKSGKLENYLKRKRKKNASKEKKKLPFAIN